jgi:hypothetical protein
VKAICASSARGGQLIPDERQRAAPHRRPLIAEEALCDWIASARPGERVEYYRGLLARDRMPSAQALTDRDRLGLVALAKRAMQVAEDGGVVLVQRRHGDGDYSYIAVRARSPGGRWSRPRSTRSKPRSSS